MRICKEGRASEGYLDSSSVQVRLQNPGSGKLVLSLSASVSSFAFIWSRNVGQSLVFGTVSHPHALVTNYLHGGTQVRSSNLNS